VLHDKILGGQQACPAQAGLQSHSRPASQFVRRSPPKELVFQRFVQPRNASVNGKKRDMSMGKARPSLLHAGIGMTALLLCRFEPLV